MQMFVRLLLLTVRCRILGRFQLHDHSGETLRERVMNVARHSISFFENGRQTALLGKLIELNCQHGLMGERLGQFDLLRLIRWPISMTNSDESSDMPADQGGYGHPLPGSLCSEIVSNVGGYARILFD